MRMTSLAFMVLPAIVATQEDLGTGGVEECFWSPLRQWNELTCEAPVSTPPSGWIGPQQCLGENCIYSHSRFGGGIVLITNEQAARRAAEYPFIKEEELASPPYFMAEVPGKGRGIIANRTIRRGEPISRWPPAMAVHLDLHMRVSAEERIDIYEAAVQKLPQSRQKGFLSQVGDDILTKFDTNAFHMKIDTGAESGLHLGSFPEAALYNHDCRPNLAWRIRNMTHTAIAVRDIDVGEELTLTYIDAAGTRAERQEKLRAWGFNCTCRQCLMDESEAQESDSRLGQIKQTILDLDAGPDGPVTAETGGYLVSLYEKERLHIYLGHAYTRAALNYALFADEAMARKYATKAIESLEIEFGQSKDMASMRELAANPRGHWAWGLQAARRHTAGKIPVR